MSCEEFEKLNSEIYKKIKTENSKIYEAQAIEYKARQQVEKLKRKIRILEVQYEFEKAESNNDVEEFAEKYANEEGYNTGVYYREGLEKGYEQGYKDAFRKALELVKDNLEY